MESNSFNSSIKDEEITQFKNVLLKLLNKQLKNETLNEKETTLILEIINFYPNILILLNFKNEEFYELIDKNVFLAVKIMSIFLGLESVPEEYLSYLRFIMDKEFTNNSLKFMHIIILNFEFPRILITYYIKKLIYFFEIEENEEQKIRKGELISFFICNLLDFEHITVDMIPTTINVLFSEKNKSEGIMDLHEKYFSYKN